MSQIKVEHSAKGKLLLLKKPNCTNEKIKSKFANVFKISESEEEFVPKFCDSNHFSDIPRKLESNIYQLELENSQFFEELTYSETISKSSIETKLDHYIRRKNLYKCSNKEKGEKIVTKTSRILKDLNYFNFNLRINLHNYKFPFARPIICNFINNLSLNPSAPIIFITGKGKTDNINRKKMFDVILEVSEKLYSKKFSEMCIKKLSQNEGRAVFNVPLLIDLQNQSP